MGKDVVLQKIIRIFCLNLFYAQWISLAGTLIRFTAEILY